MWVRPSLGLFFGFANANGDKDKDGNKSGGLVLGNLAISIGGLMGGILGFGEKWGFYTGVNGGLSFVPFLGYGFVGIPIGFHWRKKWGLGIIIPVIVGDWYMFLPGIAAFGISWILAKNGNIQ